METVTKVSEVEQPLDQVGPVSPKLLSHHPVS